jgi:large subunit ribosomal protein L25
MQRAIAGLPIVVFGDGMQTRLKSLSLDNARLLDHPETVMAHVDMPRGRKAGEGEEPKKK